MADAADTFRRIALMIFKWIGLAIVFIVLLVAIVAGGVYSYQWYTHDRHESLVVASVEMNNKLCPGNPGPLHISIKNGSTKPIDEFTYRLSARLPNRSSNVAQWNSHDEDYIIPAGKTVTACINPPPLKSDVGDDHDITWRVESLHVTFGR
jgi:hypothetical protein